MSAIHAPSPAAARQLSRTRVSALRAGYLFMGLGLATVKWPLLAGAHTLPLYEGVTLCLLSAMSVLALLGALRPLRLLPVLVLETLWKLLWLGAVALPRALGEGLDAETSTLVVNCSLVIAIIAVTPWHLVWRKYLWPRRPRPRGAAAG